MERAHCSASSNLENAMSIRLLAALAIFLGLSRRFSPNRPKSSCSSARGPMAIRPQTHEYVAGLKILKKCLEPVEALEIVSVRADEP